MTMSLQLMIPSSSALELSSGGGGGGGGGGKAISKKPVTAAAAVIPSKPSTASAAAGRGGVYRKRKYAAADKRNVSAKRPHYHHNTAAASLAVSDDDSDEESGGRKAAATQQPLPTETAKVKRARRARRRPHKGYYEMTERERSRLEERERQRTARIRERMRAKGHMVAPYNTTEFLLDEHQTDAMRRLDAALTTSTENLFAASPTRVVPLPGRGRRTSSSFSLESDEGCFYSSPDDAADNGAVDDDFMSREFSKDYDNGNVDRLSRMEKSALIQEYLGMEKKVEALEKRMEEINHCEAMKALTGEVDYEFHRGEIPMEPETATKIRVFQAEISRLLRENTNLNLENTSLRRRLRSSASSHTCSSSSSSSSSDDESSSSSSSSSSSEEEEEEDEAAALETVAAVDGGVGVSQLAGEEDQRGEEVGGRTEDTGYESTQSKEDTPEPGAEEEKKKKAL